MPFSTKSSPNLTKMQTKLSAWTPLNHPPSNNKIFEERRSLMSKWFDRWSDRQRKQVLQDFLLMCSKQQLRFLSSNLTRQLPLQAADFTCTLPRILSLYVFSFLDPRSLSRCAQVSWHWRSLVELDQLWRPKSLKLGWSINFTPTLAENSAWKRLYIQRVLELRLRSKARDRQQQNQTVSRGPISAGDDVDLTEPPASFSPPSPASVPQKKKQKTPPPWKASDPRPKDTFRYNYLDNMDPLERGHLKSRVSCATATPRDREKNNVSDKNYKLRKAKSMMFLTSNPRRPNSPLQTGVDDKPVVTKTSQLHTTENAGTRPGPVRSPVPRLSKATLRAVQRSHRSTPSEWRRRGPSWRTGIGGMIQIRKRGGESRSFAAFVSKQSRLRPDCDARPMKDDRVLHCPRPGIDQFGNRRSIEEVGN